MKICSKQDHVNTRLEQNGYALISSGQFSMPPALLDHKERFLSDWPELEADTYLKKGSHFRFRRFNYFYFMPDGTGVKPFPPMPYYQSGDYNRYAGDVQRHFSPFSYAAKHNPFLHALIQFNFEQLPLTPERRNGPWKVESHQIRVVARANEKGEPTPEGVHQDGVDFVFVYLIGRNNIKGGESIIHDTDGNDLYRHTLENPFDALVVWDPKVFHGATSIVPDDITKEGFRDILLIGFTYQADLNPPKPEISCNE